MWEREGEEEKNSRTLTDVEKTGEKNERINRRRGEHKMEKKKIVERTTRRLYATAAAADALLHTYTEFPNKEERTI